MTCGRDEGRRENEHARRLRTSPRPSQRVSRANLIRNSISGRSPFTSDGVLVHPTRHTGRHCSGGAGRADWSEMHPELVSHAKSRTEGVPWARAVIGKSSSQEERPRKVGSTLTQMFSAAQTGQDKLTAILVHKGNTLVGSDGASDAPGPQRERRPERVRCSGVRGRGAGQFVQCTSCWWRRGRLVGGERDHIMTGGGEGRVASPDVGARQKRSDGDGTAPGSWEGGERALMSTLRSSFKEREQ